MSEQKGLGSKLLGIFVETEGKPAEGKSAADEIAELAGKVNAGAKPPAKTVPAPLAEPLPPNLKLQPAPASATAATLDFDAIFKDAGMDVAELDRVKKAQELLKTLPEATPQPVKKQIVEASLKAFGFEIEKIIQGAQNQKRALDAYLKVNESATAKSITDAEAQIKSLNDKIAALRTDIEKRTAQLGSLSTATQARKSEVQRVIDFFQAPVEPPK